MGTLESFVSTRMPELSERPMIQQVDHYVRLTRNVTLPPMQVHKTVGSAKIPVLTKRLNEVTEPLHPPEKPLKELKPLKAMKHSNRGQTESLLDSVIAQGRK